MEATKEGLEITFEQARCLLAFCKNAPARYAGIGLDPDTGKPFATDGHKSVLFDGYLGIIPEKAWGKGWDRGLVDLSAKTARRARRKTVVLLWHAMSGQQAPRISDCLRQWTDKPAPRFDSARPLLTDAEDMKALATLPAAVERTKEQRRTFLDLPCIRLLSFGPGIPAVFESLADYTDPTSFRVRAAIMFPEGGL